MRHLTCSWYAIVFTLITSRVRLLPASCQTDNAQRYMIKYTQIPTLLSLNRWLFILCHISNFFSSYQLKVIENIENKLLQVVFYQKEICVLFVMVLTLFFS